MGNFPDWWINESPVGNHIRNTPWEHHRNGFSFLAAASQPFQEALLLWGLCRFLGWQRAQGINHRTGVRQEALFLIRLLLCAFDFNEGWYSSVSDSAVCVTDYFKAQCFYFVLPGQFHDAVNRSASAPDDLSAGWDESKQCLFSPPRNSRMWFLQFSYLNYCNVPTFSGCLLSITLCASKFYFVYFVFNTQNEHFF